MSVCLCLIRSAAAAVATTAEKKNHETRREESARTAEAGGGLRPFPHCVMSQVALPVIQAVPYAPLGPSTSSPKPKEVKRAPCSPTLQHLRLPLILAQRPSPPTPLLRGKREGRDERAPRLAMETPSLEVLVGQRVQGRRKRSSPSIPSKATKASGLATARPLPRSLQVDFGDNAQDVQPRSGTEYQRQVV